MPRRTAGESTLDRLCSGLDDAMREAAVDRLTAQVKRCLCEVGHDLAAALPPGFHESRPDGYARRLLRRGDRGYSLVVMTWGPGQHTPLHDHAGMWCVECVLRGEIDVTQYDLLQSAGERFRFAPQTTVRARLGDAGCLIPPFEYHVLANPVPDAVAMTLHVYGGEMDHCNAFVPLGDGWWQREPRQLSYDD